MKQTIQKTIFHLLMIGVIAILFVSCHQDQQEVMIWDTLTLDFAGPEMSETGDVNPFTECDMKIRFSNGENNYTVSAYFAADGNAAETSASSGNVWRVKFSPDALGEWTYEVSFKQNGKGSDAAHVLDGRTGEFMVIPGDFPESDFRHHGKLRVTNGSGYQQFAGSKKYFLKGGTDSPETLLAFEDFDGTYDIDTTNTFLHKYEPHLKDWKVGDPTWQNGKGKALIGGLNYLASKGINAVYFLSMNIEGDGKDVWPYVSHTEFRRFDCSKLDQWDIVFSHAQSLGIMLHFVTQETENELLLDGGDTGIQRQLYYKELIARFAHHPAVTWNMGEENGPAHFSPIGQTTGQQKAMFKYFKDNDPYHNLIALHTHSTIEMRDPILEPILGDKNLDALSMQIWHPSEVHRDILDWRARSKKAGHPLVTYLDEIGPYWQGVKPDADDMAHDSIRKDALWGTLMAGGAGVEWYFGYKHAHADLGCEDWRSRDAMWEQTDHALQFFQKHLPFWRMESMDQLLDGADGYVYAAEGEVYTVYLPNGADKAVLDLTDLEDESFTLSWYNPRSGGELVEGTKILIGGKLYLSDPDSGVGNDWVGLIRVVD